MLIDIHVRKDDGSPGPMIASIVTPVSVLSVDPVSRAHAERLGLAIAGKGHEPYQDVGGIKHPFDDAQMAREQLRRHA